MSVEGKEIYILLFPSNKDTTKKINSNQGFKNTHTHKNEIDYLFVCFFLHLKISLFEKFFLLIFKCWGWVNVYSYLCRFLSFPSFFPSLFLSFSISFLLFFSRCSKGHYCIFFPFFLHPFSPRFLRPSILSYFFFIIGSFFFLVNGAIVTISPQPPCYINFFETFHFLAGDQQVVPTGASHISLRLQEIQSRVWEKKNKRTICSG